MTFCPFAPTLQECRARRAIGLDAPARYDGVLFKSDWFHVRHHLFDGAFRGLALRCPRCGQGALFRNLLLMHHHCDACGFVYERAPGFFLGSAYLNYGFTVVSLTV